jgi:hypothetical protein
MLQHRRPSPEVRGLIDRIRKLVAEQRRLDGDESREPDGDASSERREANAHEIARLQRRLASVVKNELTA